MYIPTKHYATLVMQNDRVTTYVLAATIAGFKLSTLTKGYAYLDFVVFQPALLSLHHGYCIKE